MTISLNTKAIYAGNDYRVLGLEGTEHVRLLDKEGAFIVPLSDVRIFDKLVPKKKRRRVSAKIINLRKEVKTINPELLSVNSTIEQWKKEFKQLKTK